jgi:hypothetical protein
LIARPAVQESIQEHYIRFSPMAKAALLAKKTKLPDPTTAQQQQEVMEWVEDSPADSHLHLA